MSVLLRSVLAVLLLPCIAHRRTPRDNDMFYPEVSHVQSMIETGVEYNHNQTAATGRAKKSINEMVMEAVARACIDQMARAYAQILKDNMLDRSPLPETCSTEKGATDLECQPIDEILKHLWNTEDEIALKPMPSLKKRSKALQQILMQHGFDLRGASNYCRAHAAKPRPEAVKDCMLKKVTEGKTAKNWMYSMLSPESLKLHLHGESASSSLKGLVERRFTIKQKLDVLKSASRIKMHQPQLANGIRSIKYKLQQEKKIVKDAIKRTKFSYKHTYQKCLKECSTDTLSSSASMLARITEELSGPVNSTGGACHEKEELYCPEGTVADLRRGFDPLKFATVYAGLFAVYKPTAMAIGGVAGFLIGGPAAAAAFMGVAAIPGPGFAVPLPIAAASATDLFPSCRCFPLVCKFDEELGYCMMETSTETKNPFARLPYPGQRCVLKGSYTKKQCELAPCTQAQYDMELHGYPGGNISGMVGYQQGTHGVNNCLRINGDVPQQVLAAATIPGNAGGNNSAASRTKLYEELGVSFESVLLK